MVVNFFKKTILSYLILSLLTITFVSVESIQAKENVSIQEKTQYFHEQYGKYQDFNKALKKLTNKYSSVEVKFKETKTVYIDQDGNEVNESDFNSQYVYINEVTWDDSIIYDNDTQKYVYLGGWDWHSGLNGSEPYDSIGVYTGNPTDIPITEVVIYGYNRFGTQKAYYSTGDGSKSGYIDRSTPPTEDNLGVGFWIDDRYVNNGTVSAFLDGSMPSNKDDSKNNVYLQYDHSYTASTVTGVGGNVDIKSGGGFNVTWFTDVYGQGSFYSNGGGLTY